MVLPAEDVCSACRISPDPGFLLCNMHISSFLDGFPVVDPLKLYYDFSMTLKVAEDLGDPAIG